MHKIALVLGTLLAAGSAQAATITGYDFYNAPMPGWGNWHPEYSGNIAPKPSQMADYTGAGFGSLNDGEFRHSATDGYSFGMDQWTLDLYLGAPTKVSEIRLYEALQPGHPWIGNLPGATVTINGQSAVIARTVATEIRTRTPDNSQVSFAYYRLDLTGTALADLSTSTIRLASLPQTNYGYAMTEVVVNGSAGTASESVPAPGLAAALTLALAAMARRQRG